MGKNWFHAMLCSSSVSCSPTSSLPPPPPVAASARVATQLFWWQARAAAGSRERLTPSSKRQATAVCFPSSLCSATVTSMHRQKFAAVAPSRSNSLHPPLRLAIVNTLNLIAVPRTAGTGHLAVSHYGSPPLPLYACSQWPGHSGAYPVVRFRVSAPQRRPLAHRLCHFTVTLQDMPEQRHPHWFVPPLPSPTPMNRFGSISHSSSRSSTVVVSPNPLINFTYTELYHRVCRRAMLSRHHASMSTVAYALLL